ncbi:hypothetical protein M0208_10490 [Sphingomonas sp. SUN019]|uniref:hypothetical protein n=1 Tax=Sphingomonas sp. SUN019 TaxID=2937788 RepID=UPI002164B918|nr:hypothetical protein [Sphingomonas sp. SUN019]UVO50922.1 hypothetical protein M0208_10490 [Sphingomonas sp. SUN019]
MALNRRSVMGTLIGAAAVPFGDTPVRLSNTIPAAPALNMLEVFRNAFNSGRSEDLCAQLCSPDFRLRTWNESAGVGRDGPAGINNLLNSLRGRLGRIAASVAAGQFLISSDGLLVRYFPQFNGNGHTLSLEITFLMASGAPKLNEIRITDPVSFDATVAQIVDVAVDGRRDVSDEVQAAYDALVRRGGGTLLFPPGLFRMSLTLGSRNVQLRGAGRLATQLLARGPGEVVLRGAYRSGTWDVVTIADLGITGGDNPTGIGFRAGNDIAADDDEFVGRTRFENVRFANLDICIHRPRGQIGLIVDTCQFEDARVHLAVSARQQAGRPLMHGGNILVQGTHFQRARDAVVRIDSSVTGSGQITFQDCIMESNPGIVFDIRNLNAVDSVPAVLVSRCWNEQNATAASVTVDGKVEKPVYARLVDCSLIRFEDTPVGPLVLRNSVVRTLDCSLDQLKTVVQDAGSLVEHTRARMFSGPMPPGRVTSVEATYLVSPGRGVSFTLPHRTALSSAYRDALKISVRADRAIAFSGTVATVTGLVEDALLPGLATSQRLTLPPGAQVFPQPVALTAGQWIAWLYLYRHVAGAAPTLSLTGSAGLTVETPLDDPEWRTLGGMMFVPSDAPSISFWHRCPAASATIHIGGMNLLAFATRQQARDFLNSGLFAV